MLSIRFIREHAEELQKAADQKRLKVSIKEVLLLDERRRQLMQNVESLRGERNGKSQAIAAKVKAGELEEAERLRTEVKRINEQAAPLERELALTEQRYQREMALVPNLVSPDTPVGESDKDNVEIKRAGEPPLFDFPAEDHLQLGERLGLIDIPRGVKVAGTRNYYLKGAGVYLQRAVQQLALDMLYERGFTLLEVPHMAGGEAMFHTGFFPQGEDQTYRIGEEDNKWLIGTGEVPLVAYYSGEVIDVSEPVKLAAASYCFRKEAGSAGRDVRGLYRVHQFAKVEQVILCRNDPEEAEAILQEITGNAEELMQRLELPYRLVAVCTGDLSQKNYKQYDIETWMPSRESYGETHSSSLLLDFQARRSNIRYRDEEGRLQYCCTLNNTMVAAPRILIPLLENHQRADGTVYIPPALRRYMNGMEEIRPL